MTTPYFEELVIVPPTQTELDSLPLIADTQYLEPLASTSLNRKNFGVVKPGIFRGFKVEPAGGLNLNLRHDQNQDGESVPFGVATVEHNDLLLTIRQQHDITIAIPAGERVFVVLEAHYQEGVVTKQVNINSEIEAATVKVVTEDQLATNHVTICCVELPSDATEITDYELDFTARSVGGYDFEAHKQEADPHSMYVRKVGGETGVALLPKGSTEQRPAGAESGLRFNTDTRQFEFHDGDNWRNVSESSGDTPVWYSEFTDCEGATDFAIELVTDAHIEVVLNGFELSKSDYSVANNAVSLNQPIQNSDDVLSITVFPINESNILQEEFAALEGDDFFPFQFAESDFIKCVINGLLITSADFARVDGGIQLTTPLENDSSVVITAISQSVIDGGAY